MSATWRRRSDQQAWSSRRTTYPSSQPHSAGLRPHPRCGEISGAPPMRAPSRDTRRSRWWRRPRGSTKKRSPGEPHPPSRRHRATWDGVREVARHRPTLPRCVSAARRGDSDQTVDLRRLLRLCRARGRSSVELLRRDATLCGELQIGSWFDAPLRARIVRRVALHAPGVLLSLARSPRGFRTAADSAFWKGVRSAATRAEWKRLTGASFTALVYHRIAGEAKPGQEKLDTPARLFEAQLRLLRTMRFRPLAASELLRVLKGEADPPRRSFVLTFDDAMLDCLDALHRHTREAPILFVPTHELGAKAHWLGDEPTMAWDDVRALAAAGVAIGAHARRHRPLVGLPEEELADELEGSLADLRERIPEAWALLAYPNGAHDLSGRAAAMRAGFEAAFTTEKGKNGPATDRFCLRRISVYGYDGPLAVAWKAATGEPVPSLFG